jgi:ribosomal protein S18 acetylase RimI-like enzyme
MNSMKFILEPIVGDEHPTLPPFKFEKVAGDHTELYKAISGANEFGVSDTGVRDDLKYGLISSYIVRGEDKRVIGTCVLANRANQVNVMYLWVAEAYRRQHIGQNLVNLAVLRAKKNDYYSLYTRVRDDRTPAIELFKKLGFIIDPDKFKSEVLPKQERLIS